MRAQVYVAAKEPVGSPNTSSICGRNCDNPGLIWLNKEELSDYEQNGVRVFSYASNVTKVKVK